MRGPNSSASAVLRNLHTLKLHAQFSYCAMEILLPGALQTPLPLGAECKCPLDLGSRWKRGWWDKIDKPSYSSFPLFFLVFIAQSATAA